MVGSANTATVHRFLDMLRKAGCQITTDWEAGVFRAFDEGVRVYSGIQKGRRGRWIVACDDGPNVEWSKPDEPDHVRSELEGAGQAAEIGSLPR